MYHTISSNKAVSQLASLSREELITEIFKLKDDLSGMESLKRKLEYNEEKIIFLFESFRAVSFKADLDGNLIEVSPNLKSVFGLTQSEIINKNIRDILLDPLDRGDLLDKLKNEPLLKDYDLQLKINNRDETHILLSSQIKNDLINDVLCIEGIIRDVSQFKISEGEIKRYIEEVQESQLIMGQNAHELIMLNTRLEDSEQKLQKLNASKDKFFSIIAHDLKSPFTVMLGFTEMLEMEFEDLSKAEVYEAIVALNRTARNVFELLEGLLDWSRIQTGRMEFSPRRFDFKEAVNSVVNLLTENANGKKIKLIDEVKNNLYVFADKNMINAVLRNLISNALKFTNSGGSVSISTLKRRDFVYVTVSDTGVGISEENIAKLFRIDKHHTTYGTNNEKGTGLGLILCKELIEKNNGKIWIESVPGKGSKFIFTIPSRVINI